MILFYIFLGYMLFRFITGFVIPLFRTTRHVRQQFSGMNQNPGAGRNATADGANAGPGHAAAGSADNRQPDASKVGEYIDFEEVKP